MRFPGGRSKVLTMSYDDGVEQDIRLIDIMTAHGLKGTFNINSGLYAKEGTVYAPGTIHRRMPKSVIDSLYIPKGMEVAVHGYTHPFLEELKLCYIFIPYSLKYEARKCCEKQQMKKKHKFEVLTW